MPLASLLEIAAAQHLEFAYALRCCWHVGTVVLRLGHVELCGEFGKLGRFDVVVGSSVLVVFGCRWSFIGIVVGLVRGVDCRVNCNGVG
jgi:hypothetical protein